MRAIAAQADRVDDAILQARFRREASGGVRGGGRRSGSASTSARAARPSAHPFCRASGGGDVRLTTRFERDYSRRAVRTMHEAGHGLYEQGLPHDSTTPARPGVSLGIHESQSRLWENHVGRSRSVLAALFPRLKTLPAGLNGPRWTSSTAAVNRCQPSLIRVEADEVDLQPAHHGALRAGAACSAARSASRTCPPPGTHATATTWASRARRRAGACRTCTGRSASSAISRRTRWAT